MKDEPRAPKKAALKRQAVIGCYKKEKQQSMSTSIQAHLLSLFQAVGGKKSASTVIYLLAGKLGGGWSVQYII